MDTIRIDVGFYTALQVDLQDFDFTDVKEVVLTVKNDVSSDSPVLFQRQFTEPRIYNEFITPEESRQLRPNAVFDFARVMEDGSRFKNGPTGHIQIRRGCGQCPTTE